MNVANAVTAVRYVRYCHGRRGSAKEFAKNLRVFQHREKENDEDDEEEEGCKRSTDPSSRLGRKPCEQTT